MHYFQICPCGTHIFYEKEVNALQKFFKSWGFKVLCGLAVLAIAVMVRAAAVGDADVFLSQTFSVISQPFLKLSSSVSNSVNGFLDRFVRTEEVFLQNEELRKQLQEANDKLVEYESIKRENEQFREFLQLKENNPDYDFETATVIGRDSTSRFGSFTIDKGSVDGVEVADPVITSDGLVGIVWEVGLTYSHVRTIIDISVEVGVYGITARDSGIVTGDITLSSEGLCRLKYLPKNSGISAGELVVTSGIGGVFPKNLVVGTVRTVDLDSNGLSLSATIEPTADILGVTDVLVIKSFDGQGGALSEGETAGAQGEGAGN